MAQVSGSVALDMTKVEDGITRAVTEEVIKVIMPVLIELSNQIGALNQLIDRAPALDPDSMVATLACYTPASGIEGTETAAFQARRLMEAGYALVPVGGSALDHARSVVRSQVIANADARLAQAQTDGPADSWFERTD